MIKDSRGQYLNTQGTNTVFRRHDIVLDGGQRLDVVFNFIMPILVCGTYTMNIALSEGKGDDHIQHHWLHDAIKLEAISGPVDNGIGGLLTSEIKMEFINEEGECSQ
jgi:lipopolysaccharide transport system ATP-binding protein